MKKFFLSKSTKEQLIKLLGNVKDKTVLLYGCSVIVFDIAEAVGSRGMIYITEDSLNAAKFVSSKLKKKGITNFKIIHHIHHSRYLLPALPDVDAVLSIGLLGEMQEKVLSDMNERLGVKDHVIFLEFNRKIGSNIAWISDDAKIERIFREKGFNVAILRTKGFLRENVFIYGVKYKNLK